MALGSSPSTYYITTPIYYVNDRPHIGHCYSTVVADVAARFQRLIRGEESVRRTDVPGRRREEESARSADVPGRSVFFLTGTDEHADKVVTSAAEHGVSPIQWADKNAAEFEAAFEALNCSNDDFIRTTEARHIEPVVRYIKKLQQHGDVYKGNYTGWYDESQEEYVTETAAKEAGFKSPVTGRPLVKRTEQNYFFKLSAYAERLEAHIRAHPEFIQPDARRNEVLGRIRTGLQDVPISRGVTGEAASQWGIRMPEDPGHRIYVWIDALFNYLTAVDTPGRRKFWPPAVHLIAKDILWFHAVIWPAMLMALGEALPRMVYAHSYWVRDGRKMSKSLGNFVDLEVIRGYCAKFGRDALRYFLVTQGPLGTTDSDFSHAKFVEVYNADLANAIGNSTSRVGNMVGKYFEGKLPAGGAGAQGAHRDHDWPRIVEGAVKSAVAKADAFDLPGALAEGIALVGRVDGYINLTEPFKMAKRVEAEPALKEELATILYNCAEALRVASLILSPAVPEKMAALWVAWSCAPGAGVGLEEAARWGGLKAGTAIVKGEPLFMRADPAEAGPGSA
jgi:methionyl-tRNA synthetase